jgi:hypothetical protein
MKKILLTMALASIITTGANANILSGEDVSATDYRLTDSVTESSLGDESNLGNFNFYVYLSKIGIEKFAKNLEMANEGAFDSIKKSGGYLTSNLDIPQHNENQHRLFLGFSSGLIAEVIFSDNNFDKINQFKLIPIPDSLSNYFIGGIQSMSYDPVNKTLAVGLGTTSIIHKNFDYDGLLELKFEDIVNIDSVNGGSYIYNFNDNKWLSGVEDGGNVLAMRSLSIEDKNKDKTHSYIFSFSFDKPQPQTFHQGFQILTENIADAPLAVALPTGSGAHTNGLDLSPNGFKLLMYDDTLGSWGKIDLLPSDWPLPKSVAIGQQAEDIVFATFPDNSIKKLDLNHLGDAPAHGWTDLVGNQSNWGDITSIVYDPYNKKPTSFFQGSLVVGLADGAVKLINLGQWKEGKGGVSDLKNPAALQPTKFLAVSPEFENHPAGQYLIWVSSSGQINALDLSKDDENWKIIRPMRNGTTTALSNVEYSDPYLIFNVARSDGSIEECKFNPMDQNDKNCQDIRPGFSNPWASSLDGGPKQDSLNKTGTIATYIPNEDSWEIFEYANQIERHNGYVVVYTAPLSGVGKLKEDTHCIGGMGISVFSHKYGDWNTGWRSVIDEVQCIKMI